MRFFKIIAAFLALHLLPVQLALAGALTPPAGEVILEITGAIGTTNQDGAAVFDLAMLETLTQRETITATPWYDGVQTFSGPTIADLMTTVGVTGGTLRVIAINDYAVEMPMADVSGYPVILATRHKGEPMSVRDKGPLFVIYPFDEFPDLVNEVYFARSVWQVKRIEVLP